MKKPIRWHAEARRLRADGLSSRRIAELVGKCHSAVKWVLRGERSAPTRVARVRRLVVAPDAARVVLDPEIIKTAAVLFASGEIDRAELVRRISR
jgi:predicted transcriptional regulator